jgi:2-polyprenyl-6-methoxyphenol hydroxylase-like FAD-dependent oxidoreductase
VAERAEHAVVLGAGMAGLLAARVLSEFYSTVTVVERDVLPDTPLQRRAIPQGRHVHGLLSRGSLVLDELFPGLLAELVSSGAQVLDDGNMSRICTRIGRHELNRSEDFSDPAALVLYLASRPLVEFHVRRRVGALSNVSILDGHHVKTIVTATDRATGVRITHRDSGNEVLLSADVAVDATGRAARTSSLLASLGFGRPPEQRSTAQATYSSQLLRIPEGAIAERLMMIIQPGDGKPRGALMAQERGTWMLTVGRPARVAEPPTDLAGMLALAENFAPPSIFAGLRSAEPLGDVAVYRYPGAIWRRYDKLSRFPTGLLIVGDALCSLNPIYGQGVTMAALQALALRDCLLGGVPDIDKRFFRAVAKRIAPIWLMNETYDETQSPGRRSFSGRLANGITNAMMKAAENDIVLTETFYRVSNLIDAPTRLRDPSLMFRVLVGNLRRGDTNR